MPDRPPSDLESKTRYDPSEVEPRIARRWLESGLFHPEPEGTPDENYSIAIPPPNVTGVLHMGHALQDSMQDMPDPPPPDARPADEVDSRHRPRRDRDPDAGRASPGGGGDEPRGARARGVRAGACGAGASSTAGTIIEQLKRLGGSCDYDDERFTLDEDYAQAVLRVFVALYEKGYIYRDRYMVNWDPGSRSAISDLEVEDREASTDTLYYVDYPLADGDGVGDGRDRAPRDDARRHRRRRQSGRRALHAAGRADRDPAAGRARAADHRRRVRQARVRHRRAEDHPRPRPQRLRDRPPPRARADQRDRRGRADHRRRPRSGSSG